MQEINIYIDNPKLETILLNVSKQTKKPINNIVSDIIEKYINLYLKSKSLKKNNLLKQFENLNEHNKKQELKIANNININELTNEVNNVIL